MPRVHGTAEVPRLPPRLQRLQCLTRKRILPESHHRRVHAHTHQPVEHATCQSLRSHLQLGVLAPAAQVRGHLPLLPMGSDAPGDGGVVFGEPPPPQRRRLARARPPRRRAPVPCRGGVRLAPPHHRADDGDAQPPPRHELHRRGGLARGDGGGLPAVERHRLAPPQHAAQQLPLVSVPPQRRHRGARLPARPPAQRRRHALTHRRRLRRVLPPRRDRGRLPARRPACRRAPPDEGCAMRLAPLSHRRTHRLATPAANGRGEARARRTTRDGGGAPAVERRRLATAQHAAHEPSLPPVPLQRHDRNARLPARPAPQHRRHARSLRCCGRRELPPRGHRRPRTRHRPARRGAPREPALRTVARPSLESAAARAARHAARHATQQHRTLMPLLNRRQPRRPRRRHAAVGPAEQRAPLARRLAVHLAPSPPRPHLWTARPPTERPQPPLRLLALRNRAVAPLRESLGQHARLQHAAAQQSGA